MQEKIQKLLSELRSALERVYGDNLLGLYVYGSYARGEEDIQSDIDVAVVLKDFQNYWQEIQRTSFIISELSLKYGITISPIRIRKNIWSSEDSPFLNNVRRESIAV